MRGVTKSYRSGAGSFTALDSIDLRVAPGEFLAIVGRSGSGKSTLLNLLSGIDRPSSGAVVVQGTSLGSLNEEQLAVWRGRHVGVVFQFFQLLPTLTILENVLLPMDFARQVPTRQRRPRGMELLERVGIAAQADKFPSTLSGGEQQRAALARALSNDPPILVADEPTGNLDSHATESIFDLFADLAGDGKTLVTVTHEREIAAWSSRVVTLVDGRIDSRDGGEAA